MYQDDCRSPRPARAAGDNRQFYLRDAAAKADDVDDNHGWRLYVSDYSC